MLSACCSHSIYTDTVVVSDHSLPASREVLRVYAFSRKTFNYEHQLLQPEIACRGFSAGECHYCTLQHYFLLYSGVVILARSALSYRRYITSTVSTAS